MPLLKRHTTLFDKNIFYNLLQGWGSQTLKSEYSSNIRLRKKNKNSFEIPWPKAIKCSPNQNFMKTVLEKRKRMPHPNVHPLIYVQFQNLDIRMIYVYGKKIHKIFKCSKFDPVNYKIKNQEKKSEYI